MSKALRNIKARIESARMKKRVEDFEKERMEKGRLYSEAATLKAGIARGEREAAIFRKRMDFLSSSAKLAGVFILFGTSIFLVSRVFAHGKEKVFVLQSMEPAHPSLAEAAGIEKFMDELSGNIRNNRKLGLEGMWSSKSDDACRFYGAALVGMQDIDSMKAKTILKRPSSPGFLVSCLFENGETLNFMVVEEEGKCRLLYLE